MSMALAVTVIFLAMTSLFVISLLLAAARPTPKPQSQSRNEDVVGAVLITINHGDAILCGEVSTARLFRMGLTMLVPYVVSTLSSVGAMKDLSVGQ